MVSTYGTQPSTGSSEGLAPDAPLHPAAEGMEELDRIYSKGTLRNLMTQSCFPTDFPSTGRGWQQSQPTLTLREDGDSAQSLSKSLKVCRMVLFEKSTI